VRDDSVINLGSNLVSRNLNNQSRTTRRLIETRAELPSADVGWVVSVPLHLTYWRVPRWQLPIKLLFIL
jgi:hypothetical protein